MLTSRPSSWNYQLNIDMKDNPAHLIGVLQPFRYPRDVEAVINQWFADQPERGQVLAAQLASRPSLQQAATVPLILAFYCILGDQQLPDFRFELYRDVLDHLLTAPWHGLTGNPPEPDVRFCQDTLRSWAWSGATSNSASGIQEWDDDISVESVPRGVERDALDHVAPPRRFRDARTGMTSRRFIHRSIREHVVAEHVATLPVDEAVAALLPHLWYDPNWEYTAPAAIAMHPQRDDVLRDVICRAADSNEIPEDLSVIDGRWEFRRLLARVAGESSEADWPEVAGIIGRARVKLAVSWQTAGLGGAASWVTSNRQAREALLEMAAWLVHVVVQSEPTAEDKRHARDALLRLLADPNRGWMAAELMNGVILFAPATEDKREARDALMALLSPLAGPTTGWVVELPVADGVVQLAPTGGRLAEYLVSGLVQLAQTAEDKRDSRRALLRLLGGPTDGWVAEQLVNGVVQLAQTAEDKRQARGGLLRLLVGHADGSTAAVLLGGVIQLAPAARDKREARDALFRLLGGPTEDWVAEKLVDGVVQLAQTAEDKRHARDALLGLLTSQTNASTAARLADGVVQLIETEADKRQARDALLRWLTDQTDGWLATPSAVAPLAGALLQLDPTGDYKQAYEKTGFPTYLGDSSMFGALMGKELQLDSAAEDERANDPLLELLAGPADGWHAAWLARQVVQLAQTAEDRRQARDALLGLLANPTEDWVAEKLVDGVVQLAQTAEDKRHAREALLGLLASQTDVGTAARLVGGLVQLAQTEADKRHAREALLGLLASQTDVGTAARLVGGLVQLEPTVHDLNTWPSWAVSPTGELLAAVRRNSTLATWLAVLPSLSSLSGSLSRDRPSQAGQARANADTIARSTSRWMGRESDVSWLGLSFADRLKLG